jgi:hypothetical protein
MTTFTILVRIWTLGLRLAKDALLMDFTNSFCFMLAFGRLVSRHATLTRERSLSHSWID